MQYNGTKDRNNSTSCVVTLCSSGPIFTAAANLAYERPSLAGSMPQLACAAMNSWWPSFSTWGHINYCGERCFVGLISANQRGTNVGRCWRRWLFLIAKQMRWGRGGCWESCSSSSSKDVHYECDVRCGLRMGLGSDFCWSLISLNIRFRPSALTKCIFSSAVYVTIPRRNSLQGRKSIVVSCPVPTKLDLCLFVLPLIIDGVAVVTQIRSRGNLYFFT